MLTLDVDCAILVLQNVINVAIGEAKKDTEILIKNWVEVHNRESFLQFQVVFEGDPILLIDNNAVAGQSQLDLANDEVVKKNPSLFISKKICR